MFVMDLLLLALHPVILPNPGMERIFIHPEVTGSLCNGLIRLDCQFHRTFLEFGGIFFHRVLTHRTHLVCCVSSLSPCVRKSKPHHSSGMRPTSTAHTSPPRTR